MSYLGRDFSDREWSLVCSGLLPLRPMTKEERAHEDERRRVEAERIARRPFLFLLKFILALSFLAFSIWSVHRAWTAAFRLPPSWRAMA